MAFITVKIDGVADTISALDRLKAQVNLATREATVKAGQVLQSTAVDNFHGFHAPGEWHGGGDAPNTVTGNLQRSIKSWPAVPQGPARYMVQVNPTAIYGRLIELGGRVTPKEKEYLSWIGYKALGPRVPGTTTDDVWGRIYKKEVTIPPYPYLRPATLSMLTKAPPIFYEAWKGAWRV